jgi:hypothetical protein
VTQTEQKSNEIFSREREQYQRLNQELKAQTIEEAFSLLNRQEDGPEVRGERLDKEHHRHALLRF